jgi:hypothetical protein
VALVSKQSIPPDGRIYIYIYIYIYILLLYSSTVSDKSTINIRRILDNSAGFLSVKLSRQSWEDPASITCSRQEQREMYFVGAEYFVRFFLWRVLITLESRQTRNEERSPISVYWMHAFIKSKYLLTLWKPCTKTCARLALSDYICVQRSRCNRETQFSKLQLFILNLPNFVTCALLCDTLADHSDRAV